MNLENLVGYVTIFFGILGTWGYWRQIRKIWSAKSAESVSGVWTVAFCAMFTSFLIYGAQQRSIPMQIQGWLRAIFSFALMISFFVHGRWSNRHLKLVGLSIAILIIMSWKKASPLVFLGLSYAGIISSFIQAWTIIKNKSRGDVAVELQIVYLLSIAFWFIYAVIRKDVPLIVVSIGFMLSYSSTIIAWFKYPKR